MNKMVKNLYEEVFIKDMDITSRAKKVLTALGVHTLADVHLMYLLNGFPEAKNLIEHYPNVDINTCYTQKINEEVKQLLWDYWEIEHLEHVGVK